MSFSLYFRNVFLQCYPWLPLMTIIQFSFYLSSVLIKSMNTPLPLRNMSYCWSKSCMQIGSTALSAPVFKEDLERQTFYSITLSWKLLSCHSRAVRRCTQGFVHYNKGWQLLPPDIYVSFFPPHVHFSNIKITS